jgi:hypothetical protein
LKITRRRRHDRDLPEIAVQLWHRGNEVVCLLDAQASPKRIVGHKDGVKTEARDCRLSQGVACYLVAFRGLKQNGR